MKLFVTNTDDAEHELAFNENDTLMHVLRNAGLDVRAECDGNCICSTCHVLIDPTWLATLDPVGADEDMTLDDTETRQDNSRLSCQIALTSAHDGLTLKVAPYTS